MLVTRLVGIEYLMQLGDAGRCCRCSNSPPDGQEHSIRETRERLAEKFNLTPAERAQLLPSGRQPLFDNRVAWAKSHLVQAGLLTAPKRAHFQISDRGREVLREAPGRITIGYLERFPEFLEFRSPRGRAPEPPPGPLPGSDGATPEESLEAAYQRLRGDLASELLSRVKGSSPQFFEQLVVEVLLRMGYGGSRKEAGEAIGRSGDEGIDGIISEDRLGLDVIYLQAKKWEGTVERPEIQKFVGALHGRRARKGVFITTGAFSAEAAEYVARIDPKVVLIDGRQLAELMIDFNVGVTQVDTCKIQRIDLDYFGED